MVAFVGRIFSLAESVGIVGGVVSQHTAHGFALLQNTQRKPMLETQIAPALSAGRCLF
jgi:hypothetical protein